MREFLSSISGDNFQETNRDDKSVICQRDSIRFWNVITFDLAEENVSVYFAGADAGGSIKKILTLCIKKIHQLIYFLVVKTIYILS